MLGGGAVEGEGDEHGPPSCPPRTVETELGGPVIAAVPVMSPPCRQRMGSVSAPVAPRALAQLPIHRRLNRRSRSGDRRERGESGRRRRSLLCRPFRCRTARPLLGSRLLAGSPPAWARGGGFGRPTKRGSGLGSRSHSALPRCRDNRRLAPLLAIGTPPGTLPRVGPRPRDVEAVGAGKTVAAAGEPTSAARRYGLWD